jgi:hypothetical protein
MNTTTEQEISNLPFNAWECISLTLGNRDIDLVIKEESIMDMFLKLLIHNTNSIDGQRGSAEHTKGVMLKKVITKNSSKKEEQTAIADISHRLMIRTALSFKVIRARLKMSFLALKSRKTINEMVLS